MPQFLIDPNNIIGETATIAGSNARHITTVLRLKAGDWLILTDGMGHRWRAEIMAATPAKVTAKVTDTPARPFRLVASQPARHGCAKALTGRGEASGPVTLAQAIVKHDKLEWIIQKAVELGCSCIIPFISERCVPKYTTSKQLRWQKIADEAAKQCGTVFRPKVQTPLTFAELVKKFTEFDRTILFWEGENKTIIRACHRPINSTTTRLPARAVVAEQHDSTTLIIGPEGGFTTKEVESAKNAGAITCSLGPLILRVETAAIAALTIVQYELGYFDTTPDFGVRLS